MWAATFAFIVAPDVLLTKLKIDANVWFATCRGCNGLDIGIHACGALRRARLRHQRHSLLTAKNENSYALAA